MVSGESGLGKTTFLNTLFTTSVLEAAQRRHVKPPVEKTVHVEVHKAGENK
jgi:septin family protein